MEFIKESIYLEYTGSLSLVKLIASSFIDTYKTFNDDILSLKDESLYNYLHSLKGITLNLGMELLYHEVSSILVKIRGNATYDITSLINIFMGSYNELKLLLND